MRGRALRALTFKAQFAYLGSESFNNALASSRDAWLSLGMDIRFLESLSLLLEGEGESSRFPSAAALDFNRALGGAGLAWSPFSSSLLKVRALYESYSTPGYDLDHDSRGWEASLSQELFAGLKVSGEITRLSSDYSRRILYNPIPCPFCGSYTLRHDDTDMMEARLSREGQQGSISLGWRQQDLGSNANSIDFGPFQNIYNDQSYNDDTLIQDYESMARSGPTLALEWQGFEWLKISARAWLQRAAWKNRPPKNFVDQLVLGAKREDNLFDLRFGPTFYLPFLGLNWDLELAESIQTVDSNDSLNNYSRHLTQLLISLDF